MPSVTESRVRAVIEDAATAPSMHNAQPWGFRFLKESRTVELRADVRRAMANSDPHYRALHLGCGAALFNLRVAASHAGWQPRTRLLPDPAEPLLLATIRLVEAAADDDGTSVLRQLYPAVRQRHTSRWPFAETPLPAAVRRALIDAARSEGAELRFPDSWHTEVLAELVRDAEGRDPLDTGRRADVARWTRTGAEADTAVDGVPDYAFGPRRRDGAALVRDFAGQRHDAGRGSTPFERHSHPALLGTSRDRPQDWLRAGQALERVLLVATLHGLATSLTSHPLEWPDLRETARDPLSAMPHVQIVLRLGHGPQGPRTPRRPIRDIYTVVP